eukprot:COSAG02_NODE_69_length_42323_cov_23.507850_18_plen_74_part_00
MLRGTLQTPSARGQQNHLRHAPSLPASPANEGKSHTRHTHTHTHAHKHTHTHIHKQANKPAFSALMNLLLAVV